jgi:MFS family permease
MAATPHDPQSDLRDRPIGDLLKQLSEQTSNLVRQELELARAELTQKGKQAGLGAGLVGAAGITGLLALGALTACLILLLATFLKPWIAALIVAAALGAVAGVLALTGKGRIQEAAPPVPEQTVDTVKEDVAWAKTRARSAAR